MGNCRFFSFSVDLRRSTLATRLCRCQFCQIAPIVSARADGLNGHKVACTIYSPMRHNSLSAPSAPASARTLPAMLGILLTKWTIRLALACYVAYVAIVLAGRGAHAAKMARAIWTTGCAWFVIHVACAFHFYHGWSHRAAWQHTADKTNELLGVPFGNGIYFSYLFLVLWVADAVWLWTLGSRPAAAGWSATSVPALARLRAKTPWWRALVHIFLLFIAVNGAIVFETGPTRWVGLAACAVLAALAGRAAYNGLPAANSKNQRTKEPNLAAP